MKRQDSGRARFPCKAGCVLFRFPLKEKVLRWSYSFQTIPQDRRRELLCAMIQKVKIKATWMVQLYCLSSKMVGGNCGEKFNEN